MTSEIGRTADEFSPETHARQLIEFADEARSHNRDKTTMHYGRWLGLHIMAIRFLIEAERYKCPIRTKTLIDIEDALDESALPVDFYKRLVRIHRDAGRSGNRRTRNQIRDSLIKEDFESAREGYLETPPGGKERLVQFNYEAALKHIADKFNLSEKSIERIISTDAEFFDRMEQLENKDFARFWREYNKRIPSKKS